MFKSSLVYLGSSLFNKATPFILLPILTAYLTPSEYGLITIFQLIFSLYLAFFGRININVSRTYFFLSADKFSQYMQSVLVVIFLVFIITSLLSWTYILSNGPTFGIDNFWFYILPFIAALNMINILYLTLIMAQERPWLFAGWEVSNSVVNLIVSLFFIWVVYLGWQGRIVGIILAVILFGILSFVSLCKSGFFSFSGWLYEDIKETISISAPLIPHAIAGICLTSIDRIFLERMMGAESVGIYAVGYQFGMVVMLFTDAFLKAWQPWFFKKLNGGLQCKKKIVRNTYYYVAGISVGACIYAVVAKLLLPYVVSDEYLAASDVILPVCIGYIAFGLYQIFFPYLVHVKKTKNLIFITPLAAVVNVFFNAVLIPIYGIVGAAYATIIAYLVSFLLVFYFSNKFFPMPWFTKEIL